MVIKFGVAVSAGAKLGSLTLQTVHEHYEAGRKSIID